MLIMMKGTTNAYFKSRSAIAILVDNVKLARTYTPASVRSAQAKNGEANANRAKTTKAPTKHRGTRCLQRTGMTSEYANARVVHSPSDQLCFKNDFRLELECNVIGKKT